MSKTTSINNYVILPRKLGQDLHNGIITTQEFLVYCYLRVSTNPYGTVVTSIENIRADLFKAGIGHNYCNKLLISLRSKRFIYYQDRQGRRGSFDVHMGDWILPNKNIKTLDQFFKRGDVRGDTKPKEVLGEEVSQKSEVANKKLNEAKNRLLQQFSVDTTDNKIRSP